MKKYGVYFLLLLFVVGIFFGVSIELTKKNSKKVLSKKEKLKELININDLSDEFMDDYLSDYAIMASQDNLENVLIVISDKGIKDSHGATNIVNAPNHQYFLQYETEKEKNNAYKKLTNDGYVSVEENEIIQISENDSTSREYMSWGISAMGLDYAIDEANKNINNLEDVTVAVIDTGLDIDLFKNSFSQSKLGGTYNSMNNSTDVRDTNTHGTHVSGIVADGTPDNVKVFAIKAGVDSFSITSLVTALNYVTINNKADVINMSLAAYSKNNSEYQAINAAKENNIIVVCAAGNDDTSQQEYPASFDNTLSVSSIDSEKNMSSFSNRGLTIDFAAPGTGINSINGIKSGTSMATPHISAAVAIVKSYNRNLSFNQVKDVLKTTTDDLGNYGWDQYYGNGMINFRNQEFCDGTSCDSYNVFKTNEVNIDSVVKISFEDIYTPSYNYGNITNLMSSRINIYYTDTDYITKYLGELDDIEIDGYSANSNTVQDVIVKYKDKQTTLTVDNTNNNVSGWRYEIENDKVRLTEFLYDENGPVRVYVPERIDNYDVKILGNSLFENNSFIKDISLPDSITRIENNVFKNAIIKRININSANVDVGDYAFYGLRDIESINSVINSVGDYSFAECSALKSITLNDNINRIGDYAFYNDQNLEIVNIPNNINYIGSYAFSGTRIKSVKIPAQVTTVNEGVFYNCYNLSSLTISNGVKTISDNSFSRTNISTIAIPSTVESIASTSFALTSSVDNITVASDNQYYRIENNSLIENLSSKLVIGLADKSTNTVTIPPSVKIIGENAFNYKMKIKEINIPEGVVEIQKDAFYRTNSLAKITIPKSVTTIDLFAFRYTLPTLVNWVYYDSYARDFLKKNNITYKTIDPYEVIDNLKIRNYNAFDTVDTTDFSLSLKYEDKASNKDLTIRTEIINKDYEIVYQNGDSLKAGDTYFTVHAKTATGYDLSYDVLVSVSKRIPEYEVPNNLKAKIGQQLNSVALPPEFEWMNPDEIIENSGSQVFKARYIPGDTDNYEIVENIDITVIVNKEIIVPDIIVNDKTYDGTTSVNEGNIVISNLNSVDYSVISANSSISDVGKTKANIKIKLSDEKYLNYSFENNLQEKEFVIDMNIIPEVLLKPSLENKEYIYDGTEQTASLINFDSNKMNVSGNTRINAGSQKITVSLKNNNYIWEDSTNDEIKFDFIINKANINLADNTKDNKVNYDGNNHTIEYNVESSLDIIVKYMDANGEYTLSEIPKYKDVGNYTVKYKVSIDDNYNDYYNEKNITIIIGDIVNNTVDYEGYFDNSEHTLDIKTSISDYDIKYSNSEDYSLTEIPKYKDIGEYTINYKITKSGYNDLIGSNKVKIYGIKKFDSSIRVKNEMLITSDFKYDELVSKTDVYANTVNYEHYNKNDELISDDGIKTKDKIKIILNSDKAFEYSIVLLGDTDGDGEISYLDYVNVYNHIQKIKHPESNKKILEKEYLQAADMSLDDEIDYMDYVGIYNKIKELKGGE